MGSSRRYLEVPSPFDVRRRPVIWVPTTRVDYRMSEGAKYLLAQRIDQIIEKAIAQNAGNALIHAASYNGQSASMQEIYARSRYAAAMITHRQDAIDFANALDRFKQYGRAGRFAVFVSPRCREGVDLPDDLARWQVIPKVPSVDGRDPLTKARVAGDDRYKLVVIAEAIMQMCGRVVRGADDFATTVILDNHWGEWVRWRAPFPQWFRAAFATADKETIPDLLTRESVDRFQPAREVQMIGA